MNFCHDNTYVGNIDCYSVAGSINNILHFWVRRLGRMVSTYSRIIINCEKNWRYKEKDIIAVRKHD